MADKSVIVIGGGPAGMMAAGTAGRENAEVFLVEKNNKLGKKLFLTGKGRCNITNNSDIKEFIDNVVVNSNFLYSAFYSFSNFQLINLLNELGLKTRVERGERIFPVSNKSSDVIKTLKKYIKKNDVQLIMDKAVEIGKKDEQITGVKLKNRGWLEADSVIIATGGLSYPATGSTGDGYKFARDMGHTVTELEPSLVPLEIKENWLKPAAGLNLKNITLSLYKNGELIFSDFGEMTISNYYLEGPLILSASSFISEPEKNNYDLAIDLKPALTEEKLDNRVQRDFEKYTRKQFKNSLSDLLPAKLIPVIIRLSRINPEKHVHQISREERLHLVKLLKNLVLTVSNYTSFADAIITSGGISVDEINPSTMESKLVKGLFFAGEIIDVDALTGGFNLQIAFSTGYLAGLNSC